MLSTDQLFAGDGWESFHDVLFELDEQERTPEQLRLVFEALPEVVRDIAHCWGLGDTVFRDEAFVYLRDKRVEQG